MNHSQISNQPSAMSRFSPFLWGLTGLFLITYGLFAFNAGSKVSPILNPVTGADDTVAYIVEQANNGTQMAGTAEAEVLPAWINLIARIESSEYIHGSDSIMNTEQHFYAMEETKKHVLSTHMMLGLVLMATGFFQFWPAFRRKHRKTHRVLGVVYIIAGFSSMAMSTYYLLNTEVSKIYSQFVFYAGLWIMLSTVVIGLSLACYAIIKRNIAVHLGWQAFAFGSFLTAPIQRLYWIGMAPLSDGASFNEMNIVMNVTLFAQAFLGGYILFYLNRESSPLRNSTNTLSGSSYADELKAYGSYAVFFVVWLLAAVFYIVAPGFAANDFMQQQAPASAALWHDAILNSSLPALLLIVLAALLATAARLLTATPEKLQKMWLEPKVLLAAGAVTGIIFLRWGWQLGMPSHTHSLAGVFYTAAGIFLIWFLAMVARAIHSQRFGKMKEWLWFASLFAASPGVLYGLLYVVNAINLVPEPYRQQGHGYQLAAGAALLVPVFFGHIFAIYSAETKRYAVN
ncbi:DUF2306 domain-containing protein [Marinobacter sp. AL4B]|uniref:DUF2306 domain-containing protein n=1 Tax=Marinobacter sp. AL4B TaxID=2871173 RepID=UPI001CAA805A|nr:DUF2306 domain-containing protein [Marinobacter sp. AL4B]MBZ0334000.1 DUF2306 domain-containing protein [Marinobacter sp. AL4B]